jgi:UDP-glucose 4-epimerase
MQVMVTGGAGYIGSHAVRRLLEDDHSVVVIDNLSRGHREAAEALLSLAPDRVTFVEADTGDRAAMEQTLRDHDIDTVMHFAAYALVGESMTEPLLYHRNNTASALTLIEACHAAGVSRFVFSSTCATYGEPSPENIPISETCPQAPINPYGASKLHVERILRDYAEACAAGDRPFACAALRYFNVAGADRHGLLGEDHDPETHLIPIVLQAALGQREKVVIFGADYPTPDGTCIRDYIHVDDLVDAHVAVMDALNPADPGETMRTYNLGIGKGLSVREIIDAAKRVTGKDFRVEEGERRAGDPPTLYADPSKISGELGWTASIQHVEEMIEHAWKWFQTHPQGWKSRQGPSIASA